MTLFVKLDTTWPDDDRIIEAGLDGAGLHATAMCLAKRLETDGWIGRRLLARYGGTTELIDRLIELGLLRSDGDRIRPAGWLDANPSQDAIAAKREAKREAAWRGNHKRWDHDGPVENCTLCTPPAHVIARCDRTDRRTDTAGTEVRSPESESESESETETTSDTSLRTTHNPEPDPSPAVEVDQAVNKAVGIVARTRAQTGDNPAALAAHIGANMPDHERAELRDLIASGQTPEAAAAALCDPLRGVVAPPADPEAVAAAEEKAKRREAQAQATLERITANPRPNPQAGIAAARAAKAALQPPTEATAEPSTASVEEPSW